MILSFAAKPAFNVVQHEFHTPVAAKKKHSAEAIKKLSDIYRIQEYILHERKYSNPDMRYRDNLLFIAGINFGLRAGDLAALQIGHVVTPEGHLRSKVTVREGKTGKPRDVYINNSVFEALKLYLSDKEIDLDDYLFPNFSNNNSTAYYDVISQKKKDNGDGYEINGGVNTGLSVESIERILKKIIMKEVGIDVHASTHCLRKTFAYQVIMTAPQRDRAIEHLQMIFNHSSPQITLRYAGITDDEIRDTYMSLDLGYSGNSNNIVRMDFGQSSGLAV